MELSINLQKCTLGVETTYYILPGSRALVLLQIYKYYNLLNLNHHTLYTLKTKNHIY